MGLGCCTSSILGCGSRDMAKGRSYSLLGVGWEEKGQETTLEVCRQCRRVGPVVLVPLDYCFCSLDSPFLIYFFWSCVAHRCVLRGCWELFNNFTMDVCFGWKRRLQLLLNSLTSWGILVNNLKHFNDLAFWSIEVRVIIWHQAEQK